MAASLAGLASVLIWIYLIAFRGGFWRLHLAPAAGLVPARSVVAVVPARDEAALVGRSLVSLLAQDCPGRLTIVLVDDHSTDGTAEAARAAAAAPGAPGRLIVLRARPVPEGWTGKLWAVREGIAAARRRRAAPTRRDAAGNRAVLRGGDDRFRYFLLARPRRLLEGTVPGRGAALR